MFQKPRLTGDFLPYLLRSTPVASSYFRKERKKMKVLSRVRLFCNSMNCSLPGSSMHGIFQARVLEWVALPTNKNNIIRTNFIIAMTVL